MSAIGFSAVNFRSRRHVLPGFGFSLGFTLLYLSAIVLVPLLALVIRPWSLGFDGFWAAISTPRVLASLRLSFGMALAAAVIDSVFGFIISWVLVRYRFPGKGLFDALIDLPFALPTAVAGIALSTLYAPNGWLGSILVPWGLKIAYSPWGVLVAMTFIGLPFSVRSLQPVMADMGRDVEEAAAMLGATRLQTIARVVIPMLMPAILTGAAMGKIERWRRKPDIIEHRAGARRIISHDDLSTSYVLQKVQARPRPELHIAWAVFNAHTFREAHKQCVHTFRRRGRWPFLIMQYPRRDALIYEFVRHAKGCDVPRLAYRDQKRLNVYLMVHELAITCAAVIPIYRSLILRMKHDAP